jgi:hypothetical protein
LRALISGALRLSSGIGVSYFGRWQASSARKDIGAMRALVGELIGRIGGKELVRVGYGLSLPRR